MQKKSKSPEERTQQTTEDAASLLSKAVIHFADEALELRLQPFIINSKKVINDAKDVVDAQQSAVQDFKNAIKAAPITLNRFIETAEERLDTIENGYRQVVEQAVERVGAVFEENLKPIMMEVNEVSATVHSAESTLKQAGEAYLKEAGERLQHIEEGHGKLIQLTVEKATKEFEKQLFPLLHQVGEVTVAAHLVEATIKVVGEEFLKKVRERLALIEEGLQSLVQGNVENIAESMEQKLQPLLDNTAEVSLKVESASEQLYHASQKFEVALEELRQGPPALKDFIGKTNIQLDAISRLQIAGNDELKRFDLHIDEIKSMLVRTTRIIILGFVIFGAAMSGAITWLALK
jgi:hypothetical protein